MPFGGLLGLLGSLLAVKSLEVVPPPPASMRLGWPRLVRILRWLRTPTLQDAVSIAVVLTWMSVCLHGGAVSPLRVFCLVTGWIAYGALDTGGRPPRRRDRRRHDVRVVPSGWDRRGDMTRR